MLNLHWIRDNPEVLDQKLKLRGHKPKSAAILELDHSHRQIQTRLQELQAQRNQVAKQIGIAKKSGDEAAAQAHMDEANEIKERVPILEEEERQIAEQLKSALEHLPNLPDDSVPVGVDEQDNTLVHTHGETRIFDFTPKTHYELGEDLGMMDFEQASIMSGSRFVVLKGALARLERALATFMLDIHTIDFGYEEILPPTLVRSNALYGTGQFPKFGEDVYATTENHYLIPTAEVPLTNLAAEKMLTEQELPLRYVAHTPCYRAEAGAAGRDTRGMMRQHQFSKVELVSITHPDHSEAEHQRITQAAEEVLKRLELPYRTMLLCSGDMGATARKTYDLEVWLPSENTYREVSSCSNCGDYQARRMNARFRPETEGKAKPQFVHTLNGSGLAVGRTLIAVLENYQQEDGSIQIPAALQPYMNELTEIQA